MNDTSTFLDLVAQSGLSKVWPEVNFPFLLAPMVGLSHIALRELIYDYMPEGAQSIWPTEMLNSRRLPYQKVGHTPETLMSERDHLVVPQLLGNEEEFIKTSIHKLEEIGAKGIDINMGCPVAKALKHNYGVALMGDPQYAASIVDMAVRNGNHPVTVKLRVGLSKDKDYFFKFCHGLVDAGASLLTLHPRTASQKRRGSADWSQIKELKERFEVPIVGNGDVQVWQDAVRMMEETNCDGVMIGRALTARPWILWQIGEALGFPPPKGREGQLAPQTEEEEAKEYGRAIISFVENAFRYFPHPYAQRKIKFYLRVSSPWLNFGHFLMKKLGKCQNPQEYREVCEEFFGKDGLKLATYTNLAY